MLLGRKRCCCGEGPCVYFDAVSASPGDGQVTFTDALGNELITEVSGTWAIDGSGRLRVTGNGKIRLEVPQPDSAALQRLEFFGNLSSSNDDDTIVRLSVDYIDESNRHYVEGKAFVPSFGGFPAVYKGKIARVESGSETVLYDETAKFLAINFREVDSGATEYLAGSICIQNNTVAAGYGLGASPVVVRSPALNSAGPVGGYKAAIEIVQDSGKAFIFDRIRLLRTAADPCPTPECLSCFGAPGCQKAPDHVLATISGVTDGSGWSAGASNFNGSFTLDLVRTFRAEPGVFGGCVELACYASASFSLSSTITLSGVDYSYGRIYLVPKIGTGCETKFDLFIQVSDFSWAYCQNPGVTHVQQLGYLKPDDGTDVGFDCTSLDEAAFSGGTYTSAPLDLSGASYTVSAV